MNFKKFFRALPCRTFLSFLLILTLLINPAFCLDSEDSQIFITGFNAYQKKDYQTTVDKMGALLKNYPDTPLRDMAIFWLARANFKAGHKEDAARYMAQFFKEYPDSPLKGTVEDELVTLAGKYARGETASEPAATNLAQEEAAAEARMAAKKAEEMRLAVQKAAAEKARQEKLAAEKAAAEKAAREKAEAERVAAAKKAEELRLAKEKAAAEKARQEELAAEKAAAEKAAAEKAAAEKIAQEKAEAERIAAAKKAEELRLAQEKAAAEKARQEKLAAEKAAAEKAAAEKAAAEKIAREKAEAERIAAAKKAEELRLAQEKAAAEKVLQEKLAAEKAAAEKAAAEKAAAEKVAREKAEAERVAAAKKAEEMRLAAEKASIEKARQEKLAAEKAAAEKAAREAEAERIAAAKKTEQVRVAEEKAAAERAARDKAAAKVAASSGRKKEKAKAGRGATLREKAIAEYKAVIDRFPGSSAAASASAKLKELGIIYPAATAASMAVQAENAKVLSLEVGQFADLDFVIAPPTQTLEAGKRFAIPFEVVNLGNGSDSFYLESAFPADFNVQFASAAQPVNPINVTPQLKSGEKFRAVMTLTIPKGVIDGQKASYPIKIGSGFAPDVSQSKEVKLSFSAPLLRAVVKAEKPQLLPGQKISYRLNLLNIGTSSARGVTLRLNYPPQYEPSLVPAGFKPEMKATLVLDGLQLASGESKEFNLTFQLKDDALALQELFLRADVINGELEKRDSFLSPATVVQGVSGVTVKTSAEKLVAIPGQTLRIPIVVTNTGNIRDDFEIKPLIPGNAAYSFYQDLNRDGKKQDNEPVISHVGPLAPKEEAYVVLEVATPANEADGATMPVTASFEPQGDRSKSASLSVRLVYSRPLLDLVMTGKGGKVKPGEVSSFELSCTNRGSSLAKVVDVQSILPQQLAMVSADPSFASGSDGVYTWRFEDMGSGEKRSIKITYKVKAGAVVGTNMQIRNVLKYQDLLGMNY
ncbi:tetratricopeptide repeat protein [Geotalea sp. SG265]|uniref:tetratricopeptide repeat protein n=1 Tax=Geotalea sp. SG265 TaxID=2922867 RepID=UPI001FAF3188